MTHPVAPCRTPPPESFDVEKFVSADDTLEDINPPCEELLEEIDVTLEE